MIVLTQASKIKAKKAEVDLKLQQQIELLQKNFDEETEHLKGVNGQLQHKISSLDQDLQMVRNLLPISHTKSQINETHLGEQRKAGPSKTTCQIAGRFER